MPRDHEATATARTAVAQCPKCEATVEIVKAKDEPGPAGGGLPMEEASEKRRRGHRTPGRAALVFCTVCMAMLSWNGKALRRVPPRMARQIAETVARRLDRAQAERIKNA